MRLARLRLKFAKLVFAQAQRTEIATNQIEERRSHHLLQQPEKFGVTRRLFDADEAAKIHAFVIETLRSERHVAVDPRGPQIFFDNFRRRLHPERRRTGSELTAQEGQRAFRQAIP